MILVLLIPLSFCLSAIESALLSVSRVRANHHASSGTRRAARLVELISNRERAVTSVAALNHLINLAAFALITHLLVTELGPSGYIAAFLGALPIYIIGLEVTPKAIAQRIPYRLLLKLLPIASAADRTVGPLLHLGRFFSRWLARMDESVLPSGERQREEFKTITHGIMETGALGRVESRMILRLIESRETSARDVMIPLSRVTAVPIGMPVRSLFNLASETGYDQFPVMGRDGGLVGAIDVFDTLLSDDGEGTVLDHLRKLPAFPPDERITEILYQLRRGAWEIAALLDEEGTPMGITSAEDLVAAILGEGESSNPSDDTSTTPSGSD